MNEMCAKNNREIAVHDLYCCLLPQCKALCTCRSGFPIAIKWCCDQDVKVVPGATLQKNVRSMRFVVKKTGCWGNLLVGVALNVRFTTNGMWWRITPIYMWCEQAITEWFCWVISIVACCHSVKLCTLAARAFRSQLQLWITECQEERFWAKIFNIKLNHSTQHFGKIGGLKTLDMQQS